MRAAVFHGVGRAITIECVSDPTPADDEVVLKVARCGICGSDLSMTSASPFAFPAGCNLGHEFAGEVVARGSGISDIRIGDRVAAVPALGCGRCNMCQAGLFALCAQLRPLFGGFGEYVAVPRSNAVVLPDAISLAEGALIEPMACGLHALRMARMEPGQRILVLGAGAMALSVVYWARRLGAGRILVASRSARRHAIAHAMGAHAVCGFNEARDRMAAPLGGPPDIVAECIGRPGMLEKAIAHARTGGTVISMGACMQAEPVMAAICAFRHLHLCFPLAYSLAEFIETAAAFAAGDVPLETMVSDVIALDDLPGTIEALRDGSQSLKIHVDPWKDAVHA